MLGGEPAASEQDRHRAIACFLSASEGWTEAVKTLGGAFAEGSKLRDEKAE